MAIAIPLVTAARSLIGSFGNNATLYKYSDASKLSNTEGETSIQFWTSPTTIKVVDGGNAGAEQIMTMFGHEKVSADEKIVRDDIDVSLNDRLNYNGSEFRVMAVRSERVESTDIIKIITVAEVTDIILW